MKVAAVDIGTNSMRLLVLGDDGAEIVRQVNVTTLGSGVDASGRFHPDRMSETLEVLAAYGETIRRLGVDRVAAVATSASRDAENGPEFVASAASAIGVPPEIIEGEREAALSFAGATVGRGRNPSLVIDIGGGSTEFILGTSAPVEVVSVDMGSVRLTDRCLASRPASSVDLADAVAMVDAAFSAVPQSGVAEVIGVAGTFTSLAAISLDLEVYDRDVVDGTRLTVEAIESITERLAEMTVAETAQIPSLQSKRAPVILAGAVVASRALRAVSADEVVVSESDLLDALAAELVEV
jgi:exopolyphosphatase/guanosine-5'-triphosphate,3'-diphosphate pyrophosphatase